MALQVKPGALMRLGARDHPVAARLAQQGNMAEAEAVYEALDARRDELLAATAALNEAKAQRTGEYAEMDSMEANLVEREADYAARVKVLAADEAEMSRRKAVLDRLVSDLEPLMKET